MERVRFTQTATADTESGMLRAYIVQRSRKSMKLSEKAKREFARRKNLARLKKAACIVARGAYGATLFAAALLAIIGLASPAPTPAQVMRAVLGLVWLGIPASITMLRHVKKE